MNDDGFYCKDLDIPWEFYHFISDVHHIGFVKAAFPIAPTISVAIITHLVDDLVEHI